MDQVAVEVASQWLRDASGFEVEKYQVSVSPFQSCLPPLVMVDVTLTDMEVEPADALRGSRVLEVMPF